MAEKGFTSIIKDAKRAKGLTWEGLAKSIDCNPVFLASVCLGQNLIDPTRATKLCEILGLDTSPNSDAIYHLTQDHPMKGQGNWDILRQDTVLNRLHEVNLVYGTAIKELIHEKFGDGIMSAIDFEVYVDKIEDPKGDRVKITLNGKFLPFRKW